MSQKSKSKHHLKINLKINHDGKAMDKITLEQVKYQCRIEHNDEDELLNGYILSAYDYVQNHTGRNLYNDNIPDDDKNGIIITPSINHACLMLVAHWYANRETVANNMVNVAEMPFSVVHLLQPYRILGV